MSASGGQDNGYRLLAAAPSLFRCRKCGHVLALTDGLRLYVGSAVFAVTTTLGCWCGAQTTWRQLLREQKTDAPATKSVDRPGGGCSR